MSPRPDPSRPQRCAARPAFTLVEVTLAIAICSILLAGMGGAILMAARAADMGDDAPARVVATTESVSAINAELAVATSISSFNSSSLLFTVPDRDGDGRPELIEYSWNGTPGRPLMRALNNSTPFAFIPSVQNLTPTLTIRPAAQRVESSEQALASCVSPSGSSFSNALVGSTKGVAQYVRPTLPSGAVEWKLTRVGLYVTNASGNSKTFQVKICPASGTLQPSTSTTLASVTLTSSAISSSATWTTFTLGPVSGLAPSQGVCIVVESDTGGTCNFGLASNGSAQPFNSHYMTNTGTGTSWTAPNDTQDLRFVLTGTYTTLVEP